jgi:hypothetical protein
LRIEVVNGKKIIYYCNFRAYFVTEPIKGSDPNKGSGKQCGI